VALLLCVCVPYAAAVPPTTWSEAIGFEYLHYAYAAYCPQSSLQSWTCKWCSGNGTKGFQPTAFAFDEETNTFAYIGYLAANKTIIVAFRGTQSDSLKNWITDLLFPKTTPYKNMTGIEVSDGFYNAWNRLRSQVFSAVSALVSQFGTSWNIAVTGHSLGAALNCLCAVDLADSGYQNVFSYNFGSPRVGNQNFSDYFRTKVPVYWRMTNNHDVVPHLPYQVLGFYHVPTEVWEVETTFKVCNGSGEDPTCSDSVVGDSIYDHLHYYGVYESCPS